MLQSEAIQKMHETAVHSQSQFDSLNLSSKIEIDYMDKMLSPVNSPEEASYIFVSLVICKDGTNEYSTSLGAESKHGCVDAVALDRDIKDYIAMTEEVYQRLISCDDVAREIYQMTLESGDDYSSFLESFPMTDKKHRKTVLAVVAAVIFVAAAIVMVTVMALGG